MQKIRYMAGAGLALALGGCVDAYIPEVVGTTTSLLVVDGFINGNGRTRIKLSRSIDIGVATPPPVVRGAVINVVDDQGRRYLLRESSVLGTYVSDSLQLPAARQYKLTLTIGPGSTAPQYESALTPMKVTPDFDQVELVRQNDRVQVLATTHDPTGQTRFYRWSCAETWQFTSAFYSELEVRDGKVGRRTTPIYTCWRTETPAGIKQTSTASLSQDVVTQRSILDFSDRAERVKIRYSVLVTQAAETAEEFAYYEVLRKNTEAVGTVNDPLPSQLTGNVRRLGSSGEPVLGFVSAHTVVQRRVFATPASLGLPARWQFEDAYAGCTLGTELVPDTTEKPALRIYRPYTRIFKTPDNVPTSLYVVGQDTFGYYGSTRACVDCRLRGTNVKPSYW